MTLPNLVGCGAGKSGTTSLYYYLSQHPEIFMTPEKEVHYFSRNLEKSVSWYEAYFADAKNEPIVGEFSTSYFAHPDVPAQMAQLVPKAKLLFIFREPVERAYSHYHFAITIGKQDPKQSFSEAIRDPSQKEPYIDYSCYFKHLAKYLEFYRENQVFIFITEELKKEPIQQMQCCYEFLGVDPAFSPDVGKKFNVTVATTSNAYRLWFKFKRGIRPIVRKIPQGLRRSIASQEKWLVSKVWTGSREEILPEDRIYLEAIFKPYNQKLADFLNRDLQIWSKKL